MRLGYNTNGLAHHRWDDAIDVIAAAGYRSVAITVDHHCLDPRSATFRQDLLRMRALLEKWDLRCVVETGARFLLDPYHKHQPTLLSPKPDERQHRLRFLSDCVEIAAELDADAVSFWSGSPTDKAADEILWTRVVDGCRRLVDVADAHDVRLAFEPEPGMFVETCAQFETLLGAVDHPRFGMT
ncbi:MAG: isomerase, partial [Planctomycetales bacterium 12-60-4]